MCLGGIDSRVGGSFGGPQSPIPVLHLGQSEIEDLGVAALGDENICRLNIAMHNAFAMRSIERLRNFDPQTQHGFEFQRTPGDQVLESDAIQVLHHYVGFAVLLAYVMDRTNVGMVQGGSRLGFAAETR